MIPPTLPPGVVVSKRGKRELHHYAQAQPLDLLRDCPRRASET